MNMMMPLQKEKTCMNVTHSIYISSVSKSTFFPLCHQKTFINFKQIFPSSRARSRNKIYGFLGREVEQLYRRALLPLNTV